MKVLKKSVCSKERIRLQKNNIIFKEGTILKSRHLGSIAMTDKLG